MLAGIRIWLDRYARWPGVAAWAALIFALSSIPNNFEPSRSAIPADKIVHGIEFGMFALLLAWSLARPRGTTVTARLALVTLVVASAYGVSDELHQRFVPGRDVTAGDLLADIFGAAMGVCVALVLSNERWRG